MFRTSFIFTGLVLLVFQGGAVYATCESELLTKTTHWSFKFDEPESQAAELTRFRELHPRFMILKQQDGFILIAKDEGIGKKIIQDLLDWKKSLAEDVSHSFLIPKPWRGYVAYDISEILPKMAIERVGKKGSVIRVNCWATTCDALGLKAAPVFVRAEHMNFWLTSRLAREISESELIPGDIIAYHDRETVPEVHTAIFVSPDLVYHKFRTDPGAIRLQDFSEMHSYYQHYQLHFFRMASMSDFIRQNEAELSLELKARMAEVDEMERAVFRLGAIDSSEKKNEDRKLVYSYWKKIHSLINLSNEQMYRHSSGPAERFLWEDLRHRLLDLKVVDADASP